MLSTASSPRHPSLLRCSFSWFLVSLLAAVAAWVLTYFMRFVGFILFYEQNRPALVYYGFIFSTALVIGCLAAIGQSVVLRRYLPAVRPWQWVLASGLGVSVGVLIAIPGSSLWLWWEWVDTVGYMWSQMIGGAITFGIVGLVVGAAQLLVLRRHVPHAWLWLVTTCIAVLLAGLLQPIRMLSLGVYPVIMAFVFGRLCCTADTGAQSIHTSSDAR